jgi:hypothetical protein
MNPILISGFNIKYSFGPSFEIHVIIRNMFWVFIAIAAIAVLWFILRATG